MDVPRDRGGPRSPSGVRPVNFGALDTARGGRAPSRGCFNRVFRPGRPPSQGGDKDGGRLNLNQMGVFGRLEELIDNHMTHTRERIYRASHTRGTAEL